MRSASPLTQPGWEPSCQAQHCSALLPPICLQREQGLSPDGLVTDDKAGAELTYRHGCPTLCSSSYGVAPLTSTLFTASPGFRCSVNFSHPLLQSISLCSLHLPPSPAPSAQALLTWSSSPRAAGPSCSAHCCLTSRHKLPLLAMGAVGPCPCVRGNARRMPSEGMTSYSPGIPEFASRLGPAHRIPQAKVSRDLQSRLILKHS